MSETRHRRAVQALTDHLIQAENAALAGALNLRKRYGSWVESSRIRSVAMARGAVTSRALLSIEGGGA
ncbi:MAG: hypothetical protein BroJett013_15130 [Alphaproteobacteria bacterium]|nr:MAG: hypothetical protein BroJett013_15130 [Alphaproteobacteria bacterium]